MQVGLFNVTYDGHSVVTLDSTAGDEVSWRNLLDVGIEMRVYFKRSQPGSDWGCDGVGYDVQKRLLQVKLHRSGVGPVDFSDGLGRYKATLPSATGHY